MEAQRYRILIVGPLDGVNLESSYERAFRSLGYEVTALNLVSTVQRYARFGKFGRIFHAFVPVEQWTRKANRELVVAALASKYDLIVVFGSAPIQVGALAQIRASMRTRLAWVWPDTLLNLPESIPPCLRIFHAAFTYSSASLPLLERLGSQQTIWLPLAGDGEMHKPAMLSEADRGEFAADLTFIGGWRPEREAALVRLLDFNLKVWGPDWGQRCTNARLRTKWQGRALRGVEFARAVAASQINLNIIDATNAPAANMRFFEILMAGGLELCSPCAEMEPIFRGGEHLYYFHELDELSACVTNLLSDPKKARNVAQAGHELTKEHHTYVHRAHQICETCLSAN